MGACENVHGVSHAKDTYQMLAEILVVTKSLPRFMSTLETKIRSLKVISRSLKTEVGVKSVRPAGESILSQRGSLPRSHVDKFSISGSNPSFCLLPTAKVLAVT